MAYGDGTVSLKVGYERYGDNNGTTDNTTTLCVSGKEIGNKSSYYEFPIGSSFGRIADEKVLYVCSTEQGDMFLEHRKVSFAYGYVVDAKDRLKGADTCYYVRFYTGEEIEETDWINVVKEQYETGALQAAS